jgi:tRNA(Arg) A34 adenosine deaminase TadA
VVREGTKVSGRHERLLKRAAKEAARGTHRWRLGSVVAIGANVLSSGVNKYRHHPSLDHVSATWHAEEVAVRRATKGR